MATSQDAADITVGRLGFRRDGWQKADGYFYCHGTYQYDMAVYLKRYLIGDASREIQRELHALKASGNIHENVVRFIGSENDDSRTFTYVSKLLSCYLSRFNAGIFPTDISRLNGACALSPTWSAGKLTN